MFPSVIIFVLFLFNVVDVLVYLQGCIVEKNSAQTSFAIAVANSVLVRSSTFKRMIISKAFCCFIPGSSFAYPLNVCFNKDDNDPSGSLLGLYIKGALKA